MNSLLKNMSRIHQLQNERFDLNFPLKFQLTCLQSDATICCHCRAKFKLTDNICLKNVQLV